MSRALVVAVVVFAALACEPEPSVSTSGGFAASGPPRAVGQRAPLWGTSVVPLSSGPTAVADPDVDAVFLLASKGSRARLQFPAGSRPSRLVEAGGELAVVLRGTGQVARVPAPFRGGDVDAARLSWACGEPRGLAYDDATGTLAVACAGGELVKQGPDAHRVLHTGLELQDVMLISGKTWVTTFRGSELVELGDQGEVVARLSPPALHFGAVTFTPHVAWRAVADGTRVVMVHQLHVVDEVTRLTNPGPGAPYYGRPYCTASVVSSAMTVFDTQRRAVAWSLPIIGALPVDVALRQDRAAVAFAGAGAVLEYPVAGLLRPAPGVGGCLYPIAASPSPAPTGLCYVGDELSWFDREGSVRTLGREQERALTSARELDPERRLFHAQSPSGVSCASCHPDGHDDGHTWQFGPRRVRSQSLEGGLSKTAPYHWDGRLRSVGAVLDETFVLRMGASPPDTSTVNALERWLDGLAARQPPLSVDVYRAKRGGYSFQKNGCDACHSGPSFTNGATVDVGTGGAYQVPSLLGVRWRGPWLHSGCAQTLEQRFEPACGGRAHGSVPPAEVADLVEYLESL